MDRIILHSDCNSFYASVECLYHPEIRDKPVAVGGDEKSRKGIVLTKNYVAKKYGIKTGETLYQARQKCPDLIVFPPDFKKYQKFSRLAREIYADFTDYIEPFGLDEAWLDCTYTKGMFGDGKEIAEKISSRIKAELGITVSIGVSWNKIYAKLGSDYKKPDAITVFDRNNYKELIYPMASENMLFVGRAHKKRLRLLNIYTIGDIAQSDREFLYKHFGKWGYVLHSFANGYDIEPVKKYKEYSEVKSVGHSFTLPRDLYTDEEVFTALTVLSDAVGARLREGGMTGNIIGISIKENNLFAFERQKKINYYTNINDEILKEAYSIFKNSYNWINPIRAVGVRVSGIEERRVPVQLDIFGQEKRRQKLRNLDNAVDDIRYRFGNDAVMRGNELIDSSIFAISPKMENSPLPASYF